MQAAVANGRRVGVAFVGLGGAVASTAVAGIELLRSGAADPQGLPLAKLPLALSHPLAAHTNLVFAGWDIAAEDLAEAARTHRVLDPAQLEGAAPALEALKPWPAVGNASFCRNVGGGHRLNATSHRAAVEVIRGNLDDFRSAAELDGLVVVNLASTEAKLDPKAVPFASVNLFERALDDNDERVAPAMLYAYAAIGAGVPYANFTPSVAVDIPALAQLAARRGMPVAGKDGKTGQTMLKTVLAPAFRARNLRVEGWYSANILGNRDGLALTDQDSLAAKLDTKGNVLDGILGYPVEDHLVDIRYYRPRGDNKEAWDNIDLVGFMGQRMQIKVNFLCRDSILAAPLAIEIARLLDLAQRRGEGGVQEHLGVFFKQPMTADPHRRPEHALPVQQAALFHWLKHGGNPVHAEAAE
jgi:myo-inositol-1-phosphate synthase